MLARSMICSGVSPCISGATVELAVGHPSVPAQKVQGGVGAMRDSQFAAFNSSLS